MKRSMIAVCLLLCSPTSVIACTDDHKASGGWIDEKPRPWWSAASDGSNTRMIALSLFTGSVGLVILLGVSGRALLHTASDRPLSCRDGEDGELLTVRFAKPVREPCCGWSDPDLDESGRTSEFSDSDSVSAESFANSVDACAVSLR